MNDYLSNLGYDNMSTEVRKNLCAAILTNAEKNLYDVYNYSLSDLFCHGGVYM